MMDMMERDAEAKGALCMCQKKGPLLLQFFHVGCS